MKIGIIGAGFTGLTAAYTLVKQGHEVVVFEKDTQPGGLAIGYKENEWDWTLEAFYHHWFTNDEAILQLAKTLDYPVLVKRPKTSSLIDGDIVQLDSPMTLLQFSKLSLLERIQMGAVLGFLKFNPFWKPLEKVRAAAFLSSMIGNNAYQKIWYPLLFGKFGTFTDSISLAWFWARIAKRTTSLAYPEGGFLQFANTLSDRIIEAGGEIRYGSSIESLNTDIEGKVHVGNLGIFDKCIVTLPSFLFAKIAKELPETYTKKLLSLKGLGAVILILRLKEPFFKDRTYWLNICDTKAPVLAIVEHTNFMDKSHYNNEHLVYLGNYLPPDHKYFSLSEKELLKEFIPYLKTLNPDFEKNIIGIKKFSVPFAQPIIPVNYSKEVPPFETPLKNVYLANMQQVYPWDRGTNYAVELGEKIAALITK